MTKEEVIAKWNSLSPRERDAWIAETVMNLCVLDHVTQYGDGCVLSDTGFDEWEKHPEYGKIEDPELLSPYSTDISAVFEVLEKYPLWSMSRTEVFEGSVTYEVSVWSTTESDPVDLIGNVFASIACLAALIAHYEEESE